MSSNDVLTTEVTPAQELTQYTYGGFKQLLLDLHNKALPENPVDDFDANKNYMAAGLAIADELEGSAIRYPRRADKVELLKYALEKAQACRDNAHGALLLSAAVVAIHPFLDGNGRVSRALYGQLLGRADGVEGRKEIDFGSAFTLDPWLRRLSDNYPYRIHKVEKDNIRVVIHREGVDDELEATTISPGALEGLSEEEQADLIDAIGADKFGNTYRKDQGGLMFAAALLVHTYPELAKHVKQGEHGDDTWEFVNIHEFLPILSVEQKEFFVSGLWEYRKLRAQAVIDFLSDDMGKQVVKVDDGEGERQTPLRELVIERTNNFHKST